MKKGCAATVYADSLSPISDSYRFSDHRNTWRRIAPDWSVWPPRLHDPGDAASVRKRDARPARIEAGLVDAEACRDYAATVSERLDARLTEVDRRITCLPRISGRFPTLQVCASQPAAGASREQQRAVRDFPDRAFSTIS